MIGTLCGIVTHIRGAHIILNVHDVGYLVSVTSVFDYAIGTPATLHTYLAVRENALDLYGFKTESELNMFHELIKLPKIGPKSALQILMQAEVSLLKKAVQEQDAVYLSKMSGIGKKTAEKIVTELKDIHFSDSSTETDTYGGGDTDVIDALIALGYSERDARNVLQKLSPEVTDPKKRITEALRHLHS